MLEHFRDILHRVGENLVRFVAFPDILDGFLAIIKDLHRRVDYWILVRPLWFHLGCIAPSPQVGVKTSSLGIELTDSVGHKGALACHMTLHHLFRFFWSSQIPLAPCVLSSHLRHWVRLLVLNRGHSRSIRTEKELLRLQVLVLEIVVIYLQQGSFCIHQ